MSSQKSIRLTLSRRHQNGQVAIFVALIFQVIFVFFALLVNVGLLVHHKINLQHSTDIAAYYGAMKQAEQLNAIAHVNFQIRQAWKLLTWRYRVLGTFGVIKSVTGNQQQQDYPFDFIGINRFAFNGTRGQTASAGSPFANGDPNMKCNVAGQQVGIQDIPFFCIGHSFIKEWPQAESLCQMNCNSFTGIRVIQELPTPSTASILGSNPGRAVNNLVRDVNNRLEMLCERFTGVQGSSVAQFLLAYLNDVNFRIETIKMLAGNLSQDVDRMVDLEGNSIRVGSERTFKNNLTEANFAGLSDASFQAYNGLSSNTCRFRDGSSNNNNIEFLKKIDFQLINYFVFVCDYNRGTGQRQGVRSLYGGPSGIEPLIDAQISQQERDILLSVFRPENRHTVGYEKNPHCVEYFAVRTTSEPNIPFLPLSKIKLNALAVAKPFGGTVGPQYGTDWPKNSPRSTFVDSNQQTKIDQTLPMRDARSQNNSLITQSIMAQPNFSLFVGDKLGVRNLDYLAAFDSMLTMRDIENYPGKNNRSNMNIGSNSDNNGEWPAFANWENITNIPNDERNFDVLSSDDSAAVGTRAAEIVAIAPNQFDIFYYSIDPDFYNNYYVKIYNAFEQIKAASGASVNLNRNQLRSDFGAYGMDGRPGGRNVLDTKSFSVKDQIYLKNRVLDTTPRVPPAHQVAGAGGSRTYDRIFNYLVTLQTSVLTSWTFLSYSDYRTFPEGPVNNEDQTMSFGQCADAWNDTARANKTNADSFKNPLSDNQENPPTPGNCVTGGRTGYSVKLVSPALVADQNKLQNPIDPGFIAF